MGPLGIPELIVIFIVALIVFGPKKLPELGKSLGHGLREFNKAKNDLKATWDEQVREAERHIESAKDVVNEPVHDALAAVNPAPEATPEVTADPPPEAPHPAPAAESPADPANKPLA